MAMSGFEGFEKRLELHFFGDDPKPASGPITGPMGLRKLDFESLQQVLHAVQCSVVSALGNRHLDSYVLSESSLFVYPWKIIIKTCGTTQLLKSVRPLVHHARRLGLTLSSLRYTRGSFIFPDAQPFPHTSFDDEIAYLHTCLPKHLFYKKASVMPCSKKKTPSFGHSWHVFTASSDIEQQQQQPQFGQCYETGPEMMGEEGFTMEICMTELDRAAAERFFRRGGDGKSGDGAGKEMTELTGIGKINPSAMICDYAFDPCGYSMNGVDGERYSTIHVTPEDGYSYASFEAAGGEVERVVRSVAEVFRPAKMSVAVTTKSGGGGGGGEAVWRRVAAALEGAGMKLRSCAADEFPAAGAVVYQTFTSRRK